MAKATIMITLPNGDETLLSLPHPPAQIANGNFLDLFWRISENQISQMSVNFDHVAIIQTVAAPEDIDPKIIGLIEKAERGEFDPE